MDCWRSCPFSKRGDTIDQAAEDPAFYIEKIGANFYLKQSHSYFAQVQGQLALTGLPWCDFCVYLSDSNEMWVDRIHFDPDYYALPFIVVQAKTVESCSRNNQPLVFVVNHT